MCTQGHLKICHLEERLFKSEVALKDAFIDQKKCVCIPDQAIMQGCINVANNPICKRMLKSEGRDVAIYLTAIAACKDMGVISDHRSPYFATVANLCDHFGIPNFSADDYFAQI